jgi:hypothetical protein
MRGFFAPLAAAMPWSRVRRWLLAALSFVPLSLLVGLFVETGFRGVNFGYHWDEVDWQIRPVRDMVASGILIPRASIYPTFCKWLTLLPALPAGIETALKAGTTPRAAQAAMLAVIDGPEFLLTVRRLYIVVSSLALVWTFLAVLVLRRSKGEALAAAACLGLSWEYAYHSRWVATDCILVQFSALTLLLLVAFQRWKGRGLLYGAAITAGLGTGTKFPGLILLVPVVVVGLWGVRSLWTRWFRFCALPATAFGAYLLATPATLVDPFAFAEQLKFISAYYAAGHYGYTVSGPLEHWWKVLTYLSVSYFSPYMALSVSLFACALAGAVLWVRADRPTGVLLALFPLAFLAFFCGSYVAMIVRNYLVVVPFLSVLVARSLGELVERMPRPWLRYGSAALIAALGIPNAVFLLRAAESIRHPDPKRDVRDAVAYARRHPEHTFYLSNRVMALARTQRLKLPNNVESKARADRADRVVFFARSEGPQPALWHTNDPRLADAVFGPMDASFYWYSAWAASDRVVVMKSSRVKSMGASPLF